jgi:hypothetical protein
MKFKKSTLAGALLLGSILSFGLYGVGSSLASNGYEYSQREAYHGKHDDDDHYRRPQLERLPLYQEECGSCHMAYPALLLPSESWQRIMSSLEEHYDESAELDGASRQDIETYLSKNSRSIGYRKLLPKPEAQIPMRITELPYFIREHDEIPSRFVEGNDNVGSLSQCNACHRNAEQGDYDEDNIVIPGVGRWDD